MENHIKSIKVNKILHLQDFEIDIEKISTPHLFITGKNGSGKTTLLNSIADFLENIINGNYASLISHKKSIDSHTPNLVAGDVVEGYKHLCESIFKHIDIKFNNSIEDIIEDLHQGNLLFAFYAANRRVLMNIPRNPQKPDLSYTRPVKESSTSEFLKFLVDLKIQAALAQNEKHTEDADRINMWFYEFEKLLKNLFEDNNLTLEFNYKDYSFSLSSDGKIFGFNQLSDGYAAIIDIIVDLILKMQNQNSLSSIYEKRAVVIIDEIETHLHLDLQKNIMPLLTKVFPNIQFIVSTHSPFILNSLSNAVAFDLEHKKTIKNLNDYSYEAIAEGYFGVRTSSSYLERRVNQLDLLLSKSEISIAEKVEIKRLIKDLSCVSEAVSPLIVGQFNELRLKYANIIKTYLYD